MDLADGRILLVTNTLGRWGETNGVEYTYSNLLRQFRAAGTRLDVLTYGPHDAIEMDGPLRLFVHRPRLPLRIDPRLWIDPLFRFSDLATRVGRERYVLVHSGTPDPLGVFGAALAERQGCPLVTVYHTLLDYYARVRVSRHLGRRAGQVAERMMADLLGRYYGRSDLILAPSESARAHVEQAFSRKVDILSRGIDTVEFNPAHRRRTGGPVQALYVGRVAPEKNLELLVRVFRQRPRIQLKVVGDGPYLATLKRLLPSAEYTGKLTGEPLSRAFADGDFFVFPSRSETFGNVVRQAMASGLPVVVTDSMGVAEQVNDRVDGFVTTDESEFCRAVDGLAAESVMRGQMGRAARRSAERFTWSKVLRELLSQYENAREIHRQKMTGGRDTGEVLSTAAGRTGPEGSLRAHL